VRVWQLTGLPGGKTTVVAKDDGGTVWTRVTLDASSGATVASGASTLYPNNPNEVVTKNTVPTIRQVVSLLATSWPALGDNGARTLTAQFGHETGWGRFCFNWNLGNVKSTADNPHMYLRNVWELDSQARADGQVSASGGLGHIATADEIKAHGWATQPGRVILVFQPPHPQCRFRAYASLADGATKWLGNHQGIFRHNPNYLNLLNAGDVPGVAHALKLAGYYTGPETAYAHNMIATKLKVDRELGPLT
jgi:hypothetical protein